MGEIFVIIGLLVSVTVILYFITMRNKDEPDSALASHEVDYRQFYNINLHVHVHVLYIVSRSQTHCPF